MEWATPVDHMTRLIPSRTASSIWRKRRWATSRTDGLAVLPDWGLAVWPHSFWSVFGTGAAAPVSYLW